MNSRPHDYESSKVSSIINVSVDLNMQIGALCDIIWLQNLAPNNMRESFESYKFLSEPMNYAHFKRYLHILRAHIGLSPDNTLIS